MSTSSCVLAAGVLFGLGSLALTSSRLVDERGGDATCQNGQLLLNHAPRINFQLTGVRGAAPGPADMTYEDKANRAHARKRYR